MSGPRRTLTGVILRSTIRPHPDTGERRELQVACDSFEQGRAEIDSLTPAGWIRLFIITGTQTANDQNT